jgi:hypothetical protein
MKEQRSRKDLIIKEQEGGGRFLAEGGGAEQWSNVNDVKA